MPELNEKLIACVLRHIENEPESYNQGLWASVKLDEDLMPAECGTTACFAGWAVLLSREAEEWRNVSSSYVSGEARTKLGLTSAEAQRLFAAGPRGNTPQENTLLIKERLREIRRNRGLKEEPDNARTE